MLHTTLVFVLKDDKILLSMKKRGFGAGNWNGAGGKPEPGESSLECVKRELEEETGLSVPAENFEFSGMLHFRFPHKEDWNQDCSVFRIRNYDWIEPIETEEMKPEWFNIDSIPYGSMWPDDIYWLPDLIARKHFEWTFVFSESNAIVESTNHA